MGLSRIGNGNHENLPVRDTLSVLVRISRMMTDSPLLCSPLGSKFVDFCHSDHDLTQSFGCLNDKS